MNIEEQKYLDLIQNILDHGDDRSDRTGVGTKAIFGATLRFSLEHNTIPLITTRKMFIKGIVEELLFFLRGSTNSKVLEDKGVNIWKGNTTREFLDKRGLPYYAEGEMGPMYPYAWRRWGEVKDQFGNILINGVDQIKNAVELIKSDPYSRRIIVNSGNPLQSQNMVLELCHPFFQFYVNDGNLSIMFLNRSSDAILGLPYNICSYAILCHVIAKLTNLKAKELFFVANDIHVYNNAAAQVREQITRKPFPFPQLHIKKELNCLEDVEQLRLEDFKLENYLYHPSIKYEMAV